MYAFEFKTRLRNEPFLHTALVADVEYLDIGLLFFQITCDSERGVYMSRRTAACKDHAEVRCIRYRNCLFSKTEFWFYGGIAVTMFLFYFLVA